MARLGGAARRRVVVCLLAYALELLELCLLVFREMGEMPRRVLERLDAREVGHGTGEVQGRSRGGAGEVQGIQLGVIGGEKGGGCTGNSQLARHVDLEIEGSTARERQ